MDPLSVLKTIWKYKWVSLPVVLLTVLACVYGMLWAPRTYESSATFALAMPALPSEQELEEDPEIAALNPDNPYLRWRDTSLLAQVVIARVNSTAVAERLEEQGLSPEYELSPPDGTGSGLLKLTASAQDADLATETIVHLSGEFTAILRDVQTVNNADDLYLIEALAISAPSKGEEVFSSRLRSTAITGVAGLVVLFGAVSMAQSVSAARQRAGMTGPSSGYRSDRATESVQVVPVEQVERTEFPLVSPSDHPDYIPALRNEDDPVGPGSLRQHAVR